MQEKKVKRKRPMAAWARWMLKLTQHISACVMMLCIVALILEGSVYVEEYGARGWLAADLRGEKKPSEFFGSYLMGEAGTVIRLVTIRSQMETGGSFDLDREINISQYYYRKHGNAASQSGYTYFPDAVYRLEDLIRWMQEGGLKYMSSDEIVYTNQDIIYPNTSNHGAMQGKQTAVTSRAENRFLTIGGKRIEEMVTTATEYQTLCEQLKACMSDLADNYYEYQTLMKLYEEDVTSVVYYIDMDNETGDIYTNLSALRGMNRAKLQEYFDRMVCAAAGTTALNFEVKGSYQLDTETITNFMKEYDYAFGDNAVAYIGIDIDRKVDDYYHAMWNAYASYDAGSIYALIALVGGCGLYYLLVTIYLLCISGRRTDREGNDFLELKWNDSVYTEVFLGWCVALGFGICFAYCEMYEYFLHSRGNYISEIAALIIIAVTFLLSVMVTEALCSLSRRMKSGTLLKDSIIYKFGIAWIIRLGHYAGRKYQKFKQRMQYYVEHSGLWEKTWGLLLIELTFYAICVFLIFWFTDVREEELAVITAVIMIAVIMISSYGRMRRKVERAEIVEKIEGIVAGESCRVNAEHLSMENAALGRAVNEIGDGIQKAVEQSTKDERLKAELLTNVSHDIKTPLTSIINYVDLLKKEQIESGKAMEYIEILENKSLKLKNLIQDLIEVSKISTGNIEYEMMPINFHELIIQAVAEYDEKFAEHCLKLIYNNDVKDAMIMADSRRMWRVMENMLSNVYKYALEGTRVYMEVSQSGSELVLVMKNISAKELNISADELSERFVRGDVSRTTEGSGLGLAIAQNLVLGQGGTFKIMLDGDLFKIRISFQIYGK